MVHNTNLTLPGKMDQQSTEMTGKQCKATKDNKIPNKSTKYNYHNDK